MMNGLLLLFFNSYLTLISHLAGNVLRLMFCEGPLNIMSSDIIRMFFQSYLVFNNVLSK